MIVSHGTFIGFVTVMIVFASLLTIGRDVVALVRLLPRHTRSPEESDRVFGAVMGIAMSGVGIAGVLKYHYF
jgi:hypothetical protein